MLKISEATRDNYLNSVRWNKRTKPHYITQKRETSRTDERINGSVCDDRSQSTQEPIKSAKYIGA